MDAKVNFDLTPELESILSTLSGARVVVGFEGEHEGGLSNAQLAYIMENGSPARNIPARPFLDPGVREAAPDAVKIARQVTRSALSGSGRSAIRSGLEAMGDALVNGVKRKILEGGFAPLRPATIRRKGHARPLIDTGVLYDSITSHVNVGGGGGADR